MLRAYDAQKSEILLMNSHERPDDFEVLTFQIQNGPQGIIRSDKLVSRLNKGNTQAHKARHEELFRISSAITARLQENGDDTGAIQSLEELKGSFFIKAALKQAEIDRLPLRDVEVVFYSDDFGGGAAAGGAVPKTSRKGHVRIENERVNIIDEGGRELLLGENHRDDKLSSELMRPISETRIGRALLAGGRDLRRSEYSLGAYLVHDIDFTTIVSEETKKVLRASRVPRIYEGFVIDTTNFVSTVVAEKIEKCLLEVINGESHSQSSIGVLLQPFLAGLVERQINAEFSKTFDEFRKSSRENADEEDRDEKEQSQQKNEDVARNICSCRPCLSPLFAL